MLTNKSKWEGKWSKRATIKLFNYAVYILKLLSYIKPRNDFQASSAPNYHNSSTILLDSLSSRITRENGLTLVGRLPRGWERLLKHFITDTEEMIIDLEAEEPTIPWQ